MSDTERSQSPQTDQTTPAPETIKGKEEGEQKNQDEQPESSEAASTSESAQPSEATPAPTAWQAIWSPQHNAYYFYNTETQETTWSNPLQPEASSSSSASTSTPADDPPAEEPQPEPEPTPTTTTSSYAALQAAALAQGIDPSLAYLDPTLAHSLPGTSASASSAHLPKFTAKFNARTGTFTRADARDPGHLSEYERAKRMSEFYFDVGAWEKEVEQRKLGGDAEGDVDGEGRKRKRPTKKDIERFKEQKKQKKIAKTAWLRT